MNEIGKGKHKERMKGRRRDMRKKQERKAQKRLKI